PPAPPPLSLHDALPISSGAPFVAHPPRRRGGHRRDACATAAAQADRLGPRPSHSRTAVLRRQVEPGLFAPVVQEAIVGRAEVPRSEEHTSELQSLAYLV